MKLPIKKLITDKITGEWGNESPDGKGCKVLRTTNFTNIGIIDFENVVVRDIDEKKVTQKHLKFGDIIIEKSGGSPKQPVGRVVFFEVDNNEKYLCNNFTSILRPNSSKVIPKYLFYQLYQLHNRGKTLKYQNKTTGIINLKLDNYLEEEIEVPSIETQLHIANILSKAESLIAQRKEGVRLLDEYLKSVFLEMFGDKEYRKEKLGTVTYIQSGQVNPNENPYSEMYHVGGANIESNTGKIFNLKKAKSENLISGKYYFEEDFILYSKIRPYLNKVATPDFKGICSADIYPIKPNSDLLKKDYLRFVLMSEEFLTYTASQSDRTNIPKVNRKALDNFNISIPPIELQTKFAQIVEKAEALKAQYQQSLQELENLYGSLSQKAFKGELSIKDESLLMAAEPDEKYKKLV
ncbi:MAG TPA: restriction endonuclease subunit S [Draconibacterium sp.]|nr:restriction endonuclease subunit S [Draconibacterium sp.]